ncbi:beta-ketoacyl synthase N-terminal-like domain-containing protein [Sphingobacterium deserti]|uniref:3-oxoacyl-(Acyl-carrier-protein) synthase-like protein n=1 Tax=Sphingobacterium deserti TaxID=1229276 RepID=A0A0B8T9W9_9SPHI|nr:beta-ketoacyl synthase N-terminal-like domain-containing protein [Sphingobacterium deserti]KGE14840.1 3-oxoacyl-(acyl-carrier-protein) synthase-like protein [Sphingobacterium deserti]
MKKSRYINGIGAVTAQGIWRTDFFTESQPLQQAVNAAQQPSYRELISPAMARRMSRGIKMGIYAAQQALDEAQIDIPDAIITGTGLGCSEDSEKFLRNILDNDEEFLTPTAFIQSTHNTVAAQIALRLGCKGYNFTYVNRSVSFESALLDASMQLQDAEATDILVGGVDEVSDHTFRLLQLVGHIKPSDVHETIHDSNSPGANYAESATFFTLSQQKTAYSYCEVQDINLQNKLSQGDLAAFTKEFLERNGLHAGDIDALVLGYNGDKEFDGWYDIFECIFPSIPSIYYKHLIGQCDTSSAFAVATAAKLIREQIIPAIIQRNQVTLDRPLRNVLLYNQFRGEDHSLVLLRSC